MRLENIRISLDYILPLFHSVKLPFIFICSKRHLSENALLLLLFRIFVFVSKPNILMREE
jgi:hypothetical protein